jgi:hypothetical protein
VVSIGTEGLEVLLTRFRAWLEQLDEAPTPELVRTRYNELYAEVRAELGDKRFFGEDGSSPD